MDALWYVILIVAQVEPTALSTFARFEITELHNKSVIFYIHYIANLLSRMHQVTCETFH